MFYLHVCLCTTLMPGACKGKTRALDPPKLALGMLVNYNVGSRNRIQVLCRSSKYFKPLEHFSAPEITLVLHLFSIFPI